tara:strand:+ start:645 stop:1313 length:669 start_codon:yes stop_codon:yes gene_type:complete
MAKKKAKKTIEEIEKTLGVTVKQLQALKEPYRVKDEEERVKMKKAQADLKNSDVYQKKSFYVPDEALVNVPISGAFKVAIQDTLNFMMSRMTKEETIRGLMHIQSNFEGYKKKEDVQQSDLAVWTLMSLVSEFNFQAQEQGKLLNTDKLMKDEVAEFIESVETDPNFKISEEEVIKITEKYSEKIPGVTQFNHIDPEMVKEKEEEEQEEEKKTDEESDTNED